MQFFLLVQRFFAGTTCFPDSTFFSGLHFVCSFMVLKPSYLCCKIKLHFFSSKLFLKKFIVLNNKSAIQINETFIKVEGLHVDDLLRLTICISYIL